LETKLQGTFVLRRLRLQLDLVGQQVAALKPFMMCQTLSRISPAATIRRGERRESEIPRKTRKQ